MVLGARYYSSNGRSKHSSDSSAIAGVLRDVELVFKESDTRNEERFRRPNIRPGTFSIIEHGPLKVILSATPNKESLSSYIDILHKHDVSHVVRVCEPAYDSNILTNEGFYHHDWHFNDGSSPPKNIVSNWLTLLDDIFELYKYSNCFTSAHTSNTIENDDVESIGSSSTNNYSSPNSSSDSQQIVQQIPKKCVAIHCHAGVGRSPVLVAIALIELGLDATEAIGLIRVSSRGAINQNQLLFLRNYSRRVIELNTNIKSSKSNCPFGNRRRSRSPFSFWKRKPSNASSRGSSHTKSPPSPIMNVFNSNNYFMAKNGYPLGRNVYDEKRRGSNERSVVWSDDEKRCSQPTSNGRNSPHSYRTLKGMRKMQLENSRYVSM